MFAHIFEKIKYFIVLIRPSVCFISVLSFLIACFLIFPNITHKAFLATIPVFFTTAFGNVINDFYDLSIDKINKPKRPIPSGKIKPAEAKFFAFILAIFSIVFSLLLSLSFFFLNLFNIILAFAYAKKIKRTVFGNLTDSYLAASCFIAPLFLFNTLKGWKILTLVSLTSCLGNFSREILKDIEDIEGDLKNNAVTIPIKKGEFFSFFLSFFFYLLALFFAYCLYFLSIFNILYLIFVIISSYILIDFLKGFKLKKWRSQASSIQKKIKLAMFLMLIGYFLGALG